MNGQAKIDFLNYYDSSVIKLLLNDVDFDDLPLIVKHALIIEWFDSVEIYIEVGGADYRGVEFWYNIQKKNTINGHNGEYFTTRQQATEKAIEKAQDYYRNKFKNDQIMAGIKFTWEKIKNITLFNNWYLQIRTKK